MLFRSRSGHFRLPLKGFCTADSNGRDRLFAASPCSFHSDDYIDPDVRSETAPPMGEIGRLLLINESRVSQIHKPWLERMAAALRSFGIASRSSILLR